MSTTRALKVGLTVVTISTVGVVGTAAISRAAISGASDSKVGFEASGPAGLKITGTTSDLTAAEDSGNVVVTVPLGNLTTGISLRDQHMREKYLEVGKFSAAVLTVPRASLKVPAPGERTEADAQGTLKLHGQSRTVTFHYDSKADAGGFLTHGRFHINMNDYGITVPTYLGVTVKPDVDVTAAFHLAGN